jgi:hypothetical protein
MTSTYFVAPGAGQRIVNHKLALCYHQPEIAMPSLRKEFERISFVLYLAAVFIGTSMEAIAQVLMR